MKILFLSPNQAGKYNSGHQRFRNEVARQHKVRFYGPGYKGCPHRKADVDVRSLFSYSNPPDVVMTYGLRHTWQFKAIGKLKIPKVHFVMDFVPGIPGYRGWEKSYRKLLERDKYDLLFCVGTRELPLLGEKAHFLPFSVCPRWFKDMRKDRTIDVMASSSKNAAVYPNRAAVSKTLCALNLGFDECLLSGVYHDSYLFALNRSKILVNSVNYWRYFNYKILEAASCGCLVLTDKPADTLGFEDRKHFVLYDGMDDLADKVRYYLGNESKRLQIAQAGQKLTHEKHSVSVRVREMSKIMEEVL